jgi:hypothetical protein
MGFAQSTFPGAFYFVPVFVCAAIYFLFREGRATPLLAVIAGILVGWGPTLLRSAWYTGNPTYPLFTQLFGPGPWWPITDFGGIVHDIQSYGVARTLKGFLTLPYALATSPNKFQSEYGFSLVLFALLPFVAIRTIWDKSVRWLVALLLYYVTCWFLIGQIMRYLLPIVPVLCLATAVAIGWLFDSVAARKHANFRAIVAGIAAVLIILPSARVAREGVFRRGAVPRTLAQRATYVADRIPEYKAVVAANAAPAPLYALYAINCAYYVDGLFMGDWFGPGRYKTVIDNLGNADALYDALHLLGATYFLASRPQEYVPPLPYGQEFDAHFEPIYADSSAEIYRLHERRVEPGSRHPNLLNNAGFDELGGNLPTGWDRHGLPVVATPPGGAQSGEMAVHASETDGFLQFVKIMPSEIYELQLQAMAETSETAFRLQVVWLDGEGKTCDVFIRVLNAPGAWQPYTARLTAPDRAEGAQVYVNGQGANRVWLDSFVFRDTGARSPAQRY